jgi:predicted DNA-binding transcriptional regulator AlpA
VNSTPLARRCLQSSESCVTLENAQTESFAYKQTKGNSPNEAHTNQKLMEEKGISRSTVYDWVAKGILPKPRPIAPGSRMVGWTEVELQGVFDAVEVA